MSVRWSYIIEDDDYMGGTVVKIARAKEIEPVAALAELLAEKWGMVAAVPDGEDSSGRQKLRQLTPEEVTHRACDTAAMMFEEFERRGWVFDIPAPKPRERKEKEAIGR